MSEKRRTSVASPAATEVSGRGRFEFFPDAQGMTGFRFVAAAGEVVFSLNGYKSKASALQTIKSIKQASLPAAREGRTIVDHILSGPEWPDEMYEEVNRRSKSPSRPPIEF